MRKLIVKFFALDYKSVVFGKTLGFVRAANVIYPIMVLNGGLLIANETGGKTPLEIIALCLLAIALFLGFVYFRLRPVKFSELDDRQKWQYGNAVRSGQLTKDTQMTPDELAEWNEINKIESARLSSGKTSGLLAFSVVPLSAITFFIWYFMTF